MLYISHNISISESEIELSAIRSGGPGGQNVNKVSSAIHLRFNILASSLPDMYKQHLLNLCDKRITKDGVIIIKAQQFRTQEKNRQDALERLKNLLQTVTYIRKIRRPTRPSLGSKKRRLESKTLRGKIKRSRGKVSLE